MRPQRRHLNTAYLKKLHKNAAPKFAQAENPDAAEDAWKKKSCIKEQKLVNGADQAKMKE
jgi:hypothetical protein